MKYDILLLNVDRYSYGRENTCIGLYCLAAYLDKYKYKAKVLASVAQDCRNEIKREISPSTLKDWGIDIAPLVTEKGGQTSCFPQRVNNIGLYCACDNETVVRNIVRWLKNNFSVNVFVGGPQAVALGEEFLRTTNCDAVVAGEGEEALHSLLDFYIKKQGNLEEIKNLKYIEKESNQYRENETAEPVSDLNELPWPDNERDSLYKRRGEKKSMSIMTGRGCPFRCAFCYEGANAKIVRFRSVENVFAEIKHNLQKYPDISYIEFFDDTFTLQEERVLEFCENIRKLDKKVKWLCQGHARTLYQKPELIKAMVQSGLICMQIGIESGSPSVLKAYNKQSTPEMVLQVVKYCREAGLSMLIGNFIIGGALESFATLEESRAFASAILEAGKGMTVLRTVFFAAYPQTPICREPNQYEMTIDDAQIEKSVITMYNVVTSTPYLTRADIIAEEEKFTQHLKNEYRRQVLKMNKHEIRQIFLLDAYFSHDKHAWQSICNEIEHIKTYLIMTKYGNIHYEADEILTLYPVRTFHLLRYDNEGRLLVEGNIFAGLAKQILEYATGRWHTEELAEKFGVAIQEVLAMCISLEEYCFLHFSQY